MLFFWNRREVYMGADPAGFARRRQALADAGVGYSYRVVSAHAGLRGRGGPPIPQPPQPELYYLYVHRRDYSRAARLLRGLD